VSRFLATRLLSCVSKSSAWLYFMLTLLIPLLIILERFLHLKATVQRSWFWHLVQILFFPQSAASILVFPSKPALFSHLQSFASDLARSSLSYQFLPSLSLPPYQLLLFRKSSAIFQGGLPELRQHLLLQNLLFYSCLRCHHTKPNPCAISGFFYRQDILVCLLLPLCKSLSPFITLFAVRIV